MVGLWKRNNPLPEALRQRTYSIAAAAVWGLVMLLFEESPEVLHPSLKSSMDEIYRFRQASINNTGATVRKDVNR
jgi:hypothetical protein